MAFAAADPAPHSAERCVWPLILAAGCRTQPLQRRSGSSLATVTVACPTLTPWRPWPQLAASHAVIRFARHGKKRVWRHLGRDVVPPLAAGWMAAWVMISDLENLGIDRGSWPEDGRQAARIEEQKNTRSLLKDRPFASRDCRKISNYTSDHPRIVASTDLLRIRRISD
jgi:hypothetical protein